MGREFLEGSEKQFPDKARKQFGYSLFELQQSKVPSSSYKPITDIATGIFELREEDARAWYRLIYYTRIKGKVVVLHCFEKKTNKISLADKNKATHRLKEVVKKMGDK